MYIIVILSQAEQSSLTWEAPLSYLIADFALGVEYTEISRSAIEFSPWATVCSNLNYVFNI
jgi:hypothetical protein